MMRSALLHRTLRQSAQRTYFVSGVSCRQISEYVAPLSLKDDASTSTTPGRLTIPVGPTGFTVQPSQPAHHMTIPTTPFLFDATEVWQAFNKAPDDNPPDQPKTTLDRQDVPATKPGMDAPESPDSTNPEVDRSDYSAPGTNPDVAGNDGDDYKPSSDSADDLKKRGRSGKGKLPGSGGAHATAYGAQLTQMPYSIRASMLQAAAGLFNGAGRPAQLHVCASSNDEEGDVGKDDSAGAVHPNLPGRNSKDTTDKSDAPKGYDPNPDLMMDESNANKPKDKSAHKDGDVVDRDNTISSTSEQPRKAPEDVAPEQAGS